MGAGQSSSKVETIDTTRLEKDEEEMLVKGESLVDDLTKLSLELVDEYYLEFLRPDFCNRVALISTKLLMDSTNSQEINGAEHVLGLVSGESEMKEKLCEQIVRHYIDRVNLISAIIYSLEYCSDRLRALIVGPICTVNYDVFNKAECDEICGNSTCWVENNLINKDLPREQTYFKVIKEIYDQFTKSLKIFQETLDKLKSLKSVKDEELKNLSRLTHQEIYKVKSRCNELYYSALLNPPVSSAELEQKTYYDNLADKLKQQVLDVSQKQIEEHNKKSKLLAQQVAEREGQSAVLPVTST